MSTYYQNPVAQAVRSDPTIIRTPEDFQTKMAQQIDSQLHPGMFSRSPSLKEISYKLLNNSIVVVDVTASVTLSQALLAPTQFLKMDSKAAQMIEDLPSYYENNTEGYQEFIELFGTHFFTSANFGAYVREVFEVSSS